MNRITRRGFLKLATGVVSFLIALVLAIPLIGTVIGRTFRTKKLHWSQVGEIGVLPIGEPVNLEFSYKTIDAYIRETVTHSVWVVKHSPSKVTVFSPFCTHLGCQYNWDPRTNHFECPCHGSVYALDGKVLAGPAPRPLDTLPEKIENEELFVEWEMFQVGITEKIHIS